MADTKENDHETSTKRKKRQRVTSILKNEDKISRLQYEEDYAEGYLRKLSKELDETSFSEVLSVIVKIENNASNVKEQFEKLEMLLKNRKDLQWEFLGFLEPYQALECGKLMSYYETCSMKQFVRNLMTHFKRQPQLLRRVIDKLCYLTEHESIHHEMVEEEIAPLLQKNSVLMQQFLKLLPAEKPPEWYFSSEDMWEDFRIDDEVNDEEVFDISNVNETVAAESRNCIYGCKKNNRVALCPICDIKFINGRMYIANGRMLRRANIIFDPSEEAEHTRRLVGKSNYFPPLPSRSRPHKRVDTSKDRNEGNCSPFLIGTESEEDENDVPRQKRKRRDSQRLKVRFKTGKKKSPESCSVDQNQTDDTAPSNDDASCDDTSKEANGYNSCDDSSVPACLTTENNVLLGSKEIVNLEDMEFNISTASVPSSCKSRTSETHRQPKNPRLNLI